MSAPTTGGAGRVSYLTPVSPVQMPTPSVPSEAGSIRIVDKPLVVRETTGDRLTRLRTQRGWTQEELAFKAGITQGTVSLIERDEKTPKADTLDALAEALGVTLDYLWAGKGEPDPRGHVYRPAGLLTPAMLEEAGATMLAWMVPVGVVQRDGRGRGEAAR